MNPVLTSYRWRTWTGDEKFDIMIDAFQNYKVASSATGGHISRMLIKSSFWCPLICRDSRGLRLTATTRSWSSSAKWKSNTKPKGHVEAVTLYSVDRWSIRSISFTTPQPAISGSKQVELCWTVSRRKWTRHATERVIWFATSIRGWWIVVQDWCSFRLIVDHETSRLYSNSWYLVY